MCFLAKAGREQAVARPYVRTWRSKKIINSGSNSLRKYSEQQNVEAWQHGLVQRTREEQL